MTKPRPSQSKSAQVVIVSDLHVGSTLGLSTPEMALGDGGTYKANSLQLAAWEYWEKVFWPEVHARAKTRATIVVVNGDLVDGNHHGTTQIQTPDPLQQINWAAQILTPIASRYPVYVTRGTAAHVMAGGAADEMIAKLIGARIPDPAKAVRSAYHLRLEYYGTLLDFAHHGPGPGKRIWTYGNELRSYARTILLDALIARSTDQSVRLPDAIIRSHVHHRTHETIHDYGKTCEGIITPAWQWKTEFAHKVVSHEDIADVGGVILSIDGGRISRVEFPLLSVSQSDTIQVA